MYVDWIELAHDMVQWRTILNTVTNQLSDFHLLKKKKTAS